MITIPSVRKVTDKLVGLCLYPEAQHLLSFNKNKSRLLHGQLGLHESLTGMGCLYTNKHNVHINMQVLD